MILQINTNGEANRVFLAQGITEEEYLEKYNTNNDLIIYPTDKIPAIAFLKYVDNVIVEDIDRIKEFEYNVFLQESLELLKKTDYLCLSDNPANFTSEQLTILFNFRKSLRKFNITKVFPEVPEFIKLKI